MKRLLAVVLSVLLVMSAMAFNVFAEETMASAYATVAAPAVTAGREFNVDLSWEGITADEVDIFVSGDGFYHSNRNNYIRTTNNGLKKFGVYVDTTVPTGTHSVTFTIKSTDGKASVTTTQSVNVIGVTQPEIPEQPEIKSTIYISSPSVSDDVVLAGDTFNIDFRVASNTYAYITSPVITVSGNGFSLDGALAERTGVFGSNKVTVLTDDKLESGRYQLTLTVTATDLEGNTYSDSQSFNINIEATNIVLDNEKAETAKFALSSASIPEGKGKSELSTKLSLKFKNSSAVEATDVSVVISNLGDIILNTYTDTVEIGSVKGGADFKASFPIKFPEFPSAQSTLTATVKYKDNLGQEHSESFNIYLQSKVKDKDSEISENASLTPKVIVSNYSTDVEQILSGDEFVLTFVLKNTSPDKDVKNMTVDVIPGTDGSANSTSGTIFSPIDGTTSFYTKELIKDGEMEYTIKLKTSASAGARSYPITIRYSFEYQNGASYSQGSGSMDINLPVTQPIKFELIDWNPPTECPADGTSITFQYFNKSKNPMTNLSVSIEGDFTMPTQYVGTLNASNQDFFSGNITPVDPEAIGETKSAILVFTFEDASSNEQRVEYPFECTITEAMGGMMGDDPMMGGDMPVMPGFDDPMMGGDMPVDGEPTEGGFLAKIPLWGKIAGGIAIPVIIIAVVVIIVKAKKKKALLDDDDED